MSPSSEGLVGRVSEDPNPQILVAWEGTFTYALDPKNIYCEPLKKEDIM